MSRVIRVSRVIRGKTRQVIYLSESASFWFRIARSDYVKYTEQMISNNLRVNNEFYVCPVFNEARFGNAHVYGDAMVYGNAMVFGYAWVYEYAVVSGDAVVSGNAEVLGDAAVSGNAEVYEYARLRPQIQTLASIPVAQSSWLVSPIGSCLASSILSSTCSSATSVSAQFVESDEWMREEAKKFGLYIRKNRLGEKVIDPIKTIV